MKKKILSILMSGIMAFGILGCKNTSMNNESVDGKN